MRAPEILIGKVMSENRSPFENLEDRIGKLLKMVADLSAENSRLRSELQALADGETGELAETLQRLKKENK